MGLRIKQSVQTISQVMEVIHSVATQADRALNLLPGESPNEHMFNDDNNKIIIEKLLFSLKNRAEIKKFFS